jgi:sugar (pentulose or hexulose) kinase
MLALSWYLAMMTDACLRLIGARGPVIVEGPFARNPDYLEMLASLRPEGVEIAASATGTSTGAALLSLGAGTPPETRAVALPAFSGNLAAYAARWRNQT